MFRYGLLVVGAAALAAGCNRLSVPPQPPSGPQVGQLAPEIEGQDLDGRKFKLSDYRGRVVLLDFWGNW